MKTMMFRQRDFLQIYTHMSEPVLYLPVALDKVIDMSSVPSCCNVIQYGLKKYCSECGSKQPEKIEPTLMHGFRAQEDLRAVSGCFGPSTVLCNNRMIEVPPSLRFNGGRWPVVKTGDGFMIAVARGSTDIKRALFSTEIIHAANSFNIPCTEDDLVIQCSGGCPAPGISHVQLCHRQG